MAQPKCARCVGARVTGLCILAGGKVMTLAASLFTLSWTHSVERVEWRESWRQLPEGRLVLDEARVKGSGAGMEPGESAVLEDGWWVWHPALPPQTRLVLAASGRTPSGWTICSGGICHQVGDIAGEPVVVGACEEMKSPDVVVR